MTRWRKPRTAMRRFRATLRRLRGPVLPLDPMPVAKAGFSVCTSCGASAVVPVSWEEEGDTAWWMRLRCGACAHLYELVLDDEEAAAFAAELDCQAREMRWLVVGLQRECMEDELRLLHTAFEHDLIDAADFARSSAHSRR